MATTRTSGSRSRKAADAPPAEQTTAPTAQVSGDESSPLEDLRDIQRRALTGGGNEDHVTVRLCIDASDADGVRFFDESLPVSLARALIDPTVGTFFIPIQGNGRMKPPRARSHWLHTQYIRELIFLDDLPEENT